MNETLTNPNNKHHLRAKENLMRERKRQFGSDQKMSDLRKPVEGKDDTVCTPVEQGRNNLDDVHTVENMPDRLRITNPPVPGEVHEIELGDIVDAGDGPKIVSKETYRYDPQYPIPALPIDGQITVWHNDGTGRVGWKVYTPPKPTARVIKATPVVIVMAVIIAMLVFIVACQQIMLGVG